MKANYRNYVLNFKRPSGTSRGILKTKETWFLFLESDGKLGIGECGLLRGLSIDDRPDYEEQLKWTCRNIDLGLEKLYEHNTEFPSIQFGLEMAFQSLKSDFVFDLFPSKFTNEEDAIPINGLIWMGDKAFMKEQIAQKIKCGFKCIKMKIGAIDFNTEISLLKSIRSEFNTNDLEIRVDANGAFDPTNALEILKRLSEFELHSIEQPIKPNQIEEMAELCDVTPLPIALDEELIGVFNVTEKQSLLQTIRPQYLIFKPSFIGGFKGVKEWIELAKTNSVGWWVTSALESNVGLNAIAQWTYTLQNKLPQGLGTGSLFDNNFESPLIVKNGTLWHRKNINWNFKI